MKLSEFNKLRTSQIVYDIENDEFVAKSYILKQIKERALKIARSGYPLTSENNYIYGWLVDRLELVNEKEVQAQIKKFLNKKGITA